MFLESFAAANLVRPWLKYLAVAIAVLAAVWWWNRWLGGRDAAGYTAALRKFMALSRGS